MSAGKTFWNWPNPWTLHIYCYTFHAQFAGSLSLAPVRDVGTTLIKSEHHPIHSLLSLLISLHFFFEGPLPNFNLFNLVYLPTLSLSILISSICVVHPCVFPFIFTAYLLLPLPPDSISPCRNAMLLLMALVFNYAFFWAPVNIYNLLATLDILIYSQKVYVFSTNHAMDGNLQPELFTTMKLKNQTEASRRMKLNI